MNWVIGDNKELFILIMIILDLDMRESVYCYNMLNLNK